MHFCILHLLHFVYTLHHVLSCWLLYTYLWCPVVFILSSYLVLFPYFPYLFSIIMLLSLATGAKRRRFLLDGSGHFYGAYTTADIRFNNNTRFCLSIFCVFLCCTLAYRLDKRSLAYGFDTRLIQVQCHWTHATWLVWC